MIYISRGKDGYLIVWEGKPKPVLDEYGYWVGGNRIDHSEEWETIDIHFYFNQPRLGKGKIKKYELKEIK